MKKKTKKKQVEWKPPGGWRIEKKIGEGTQPAAEEQQQQQHQQRSTLPVSSRIFPMVFGMSPTFSSFSTLAQGGRIGANIQFPSSTPLTNLF
jgi:hypothetical protein